MIYLKKFNEDKNETDFNNYINELKDNIMAAIVDISDDDIDIDISLLYKEGLPKISIEFIKNNGVISLQNINNSLLNLLNYIRSEFPSIIDNPIIFGKYFKKAKVPSQSYNVYHFSDIPNSGFVKYCYLEFTISDNN